MGRIIVTVIVLINLIAMLRASVISKSSKEECVVENDVKTVDNVTCSTKLVVSLTVNANEGKSQLIQANVSRIVDATKKKLRNLELKTPLRIKVIKSPVLVNFPLYQVGYVSNWPREEINNEHRLKCRDTWYASEKDVNCGFANDYDGERIFDSQGFCCKCDFDYRGGSQLCSGFSNKLTSQELKYLLEVRKFNIYVGHCLVYDGLKYFVMAMRPPALQFTISVTLEKRTYLAKNGTGVWETVSKLEIGPQKRIAVSKTHTVRVEYVADFYPSTFIKSSKLVHRFLLIPDQSTLSPNPPFRDVSAKEWKTFRSSVQNMSEWMAIDKNYFDMSGFSCNKIGVSYSAFRRQPHACENQYGSCLFDQPYLLWKDDKLRQRERREGRFMLYNFGKAYSMPHTSGRTDFQVNFIADRPTTSLIVITMAADDLITITRVAPGRIVSAYVDAFEALSTTGSLLVIIQNMGAYTATYNVFVQHCSAGIDLVPSKMATIDPLGSKNLTFVMHSFHSVGKINHCDCMTLHSLVPRPFFLFTAGERYLKLGLVNLYDVNSKLLDNLTITIETFDTCFCYGFCGCACGNNKTVCPDAPQRPDSELEVYNRRWYERVRDAFKKLAGFFKLHGGKFLITFWVVCILICLGVLKVVHIIITGDLKMKGVTDPIIMVMNKVKEVAEYILKQWCPAFCDNCWTSCLNCCRFCTRRCCWMMTCGVVKRKENMLYRKRIERGWRAPPYCNGMCEGAKFRRSLHRKLMRVMKRTGAKKDAAWFSKPYNCSCKVKDQMPCITICKGLFFFFYCPLLPVYWIFEFGFIYLRRRWRRRKRIAAYRAEKAEKEASKEREYLHMDKYSRGVLEKEIVSLDKELREIAHLEKEYEADLNPDLKEELQLDATSDREGRNFSSEASLSDTSDPDQANDIDELLDHSYPVYFNYAIPKASHSLKNPGHNYSIKGRITYKNRKKEKGRKYYFDLHEYTRQVQHEVEGKMKELKPQLQLNSGEFAHTFKDPARTLKLVTLVPLFPCPNENSTKSGKGKKHKIE